MLNSATPTRGGTTRRITRCAQELADDHGFDGFTMDDLAERSGVSRRTLFNYFPSKVDAVLGECPALDIETVAQFRAGGPAHDLVIDLRTLILPCLDSELADRGALARIKRILPMSPRLMTAVHHRFETISAEVVEHVVAREHVSFGVFRARVAVTIIAALFDSAIDEFLRDRQARPVAHHFDESLRTARSLLGA